ncbi:hypothetical protein Cob_v003126 [Colletotrichum orbiculare MAFF 240422]|uniref:Uncharacterized protein n=1 Tax=Colletotrichum orbiculare (strain 104-T / ATCC 96160 / CBS 514.97 / LARS 414 / MAFF 240422) TaxID=1213857 RepID=A0A484G182_COLOR|nr:hypothetical protein Cob_v003126 [Colletotrichum orbiculare MAFF 240422]
MFWLPESYGLPVGTSQRECCIGSPGKQLTLGPRRMPAFHCLRRLHRSREGNLPPLALFPAEMDYIIAEKEEAEPATEERPHAPSQEELVKMRNSELLAQHNTIFYPLLDGSKINYLHQKSQAGKQPKLSPVEHDILLGYVTTVNSAEGVIHLKEEAEPNTNPPVPRQQLYAHFACHIIWSFLPPS